jgi:lipopolysaccharide transport system permease protein
LWFLIQPLLTSLVFTVIFGNIAQLPTDDLPQLLFYMSGNVLWNYFSSCLVSTSDTFIANASLFGKVYFPRLVMPISVVISNLITFAIQFVFFLAFFLYFFLRQTNVSFSLWALALPYLVFLMAGLGLGFGIIISSLTTKYRDLRYLVSFGVSLWMYGTPVIYPVSSIPEGWRWIANINPVTPIIETFRNGFLGQGNATWLRLGYSTLFMLVVMFIGVVIFNRVEKTFIDTV